MGQAKHRQKVELAPGTRCVFCGGAEPATTLDHVPPRTVFRERHWPEGYVFGACMRCNSSAALNEQVIGMLARFSSLRVDDEIGKREAMRGFSGINNNHGSLLREMFDVPLREKRTMARELRMTPAVGETYASLPIAKVPDRVQEAVAMFAARFCKAAYFHHTGEILSQDAAILFRWLTNADVARGNNWLSSIANGLPIVPVLKRGSMDLSPQFSYRCNLSAQEGLSAFGVAFGDAFGFILLASVRPDVMNGIIARAKGRTGDEREVLQRIVFPPLNGSCFLR